VRPPLTTAQVAKAVRIGRQTLQRWIRQDKVKAPEPVIRDGRAVRLWTATDVRRLREVKAGIYWRGQGRPAKKGGKMRKA
jgi:excisionase family DNA binding protein